MPRYSNNMAPTDLALRRCYISLSLDCCLACRRPSIYFIPTFFRIKFTLYIYIRLRHFRFAAVSVGKLMSVRNFSRTMQTKRASYTKSQLATEAVDEAGQEVLSGLDVIRMRQGCVMQ